MSLLEIFRSIHVSFFERFYIWIYISFMQFFQAQIDYLDVNFRQKRIINIALSACSQHKLL